MTHTLRNVQLPGPKSKALFDAEALFLAPGTQSVALFSQLAIDRGEGAVLYDVDGNRYVDLLAGVGVASLGYAHPRYVAAIQRQFARVHVGSFTTEHRAALVKLIAARRRKMRREALRRGERLYRRRPGSFARRAARAHRRSRPSLS